ncbi:hypothetical protein [Stenotrophomonas sp. UBA7606]|uniref:hypothetical protein n=1 Tax=Stenotrophomonas sp. UBA7606 TaxID=1947559 RepID=UPI0025FA7798|nr:hypothetical protein [Stenotrophomonas sp. UBA7606]
MRRLDTAKTLRFALATLLLGIGIGLLIAGGIGRLKEDRDDGTRTGVQVEPAERGEAQRGWAVGHAAMLGGALFKKHVRLVAA